MLLFIEMTDQISEIDTFMLSHNNSITYVYTVKLLSKRSFNHCVNYWCDIIYTD